MDGEGRYTRDIFISWDELHRDARELCRRLLERGERFERLVAVTRGGLIPAAVVARELDLRLVDTICVLSYHGGQGRAVPAAALLQAPQGAGASRLPALGHRAVVRRPARRARPVGPGVEIPT